ncbi:hypothetical protein [Caballeronia sp. GAFFF3]|jgi:triacylglycerol lipase|uniref:esterase/lipase family protein n=1 Tax=Caballeronia sp. GAFFF3 TaxID=2921759 RepID=UPI002028F77A|nr:hypothetical protein [Caballeronia sp. GAFFF3]
MSRIASEKKKPTGNHAVTEAPPTKGQQAGAHSSHKNAEAKTQKSRVAANGKSGNNFPNVLVHGFCGWGRETLTSKIYHYFGGTGDIQEYLNNRGYQTFTAAVGPLSSNWDRACELYYFLKGGVVDYGAVHSARYGHERYGRSYPGVFPEWSEEHKVHLIGHSMGGPTIRTLVQLLEHGDPDEIAFAPSSREAGTSELFKGGKQWVHSITSIAGVNNGTPVADDLGEPMSDLLLSLASLCGADNRDLLFDFDLKQWGIHREKGEDLVEYAKKIMLSKAWKTTDSAIYDLSFAAARLQNIWVKTSPHTYYASYCADGTVPGLADTRVPMSNMNPLLLGGGAALGLNERDLAGGFLNWRPNDGCVPVPSAQYPIGHAHEFVGDNPAHPPKKGVWYVHPPIAGVDHIGIVQPVGSTTLEWLEEFFGKIAAYNKALPI